MSLVSVCTTDFALTLQYVSHIYAKHAFPKNLWTFEKYSRVIIEPNYWKWYINSDVRKTEKHMHL